MSKEKFYKNKKSKTHSSEEYRKKQTKNKEIIKKTR